MTTAQQQIKGLLGMHFDKIVELSDIKQSLEVSDDRLNMFISATTGLSLDMVDTLMKGVSIYDKYFKGV
jgi:hypothetical protein